MESLYLKSYLSSSQSHPLRATLLFQEKPNKISKFEHTEQDQETKEPGKLKDQGAKKLENYRGPRNWGNLD